MLSSFSRTKDVLVITLLNRVIMDRSAEFELIWFVWEGKGINFRGKNWMVLHQTPWVKKWLFFLVLNQHFIKQTRPNNIIDTITLTFNTVLVQNGCHKCWRQLVLVVPHWPVDHGGGTILLDFYEENVTWDNSQDQIFSCYFLCEMKWLPSMISILYLCFLFVSM